MCQTLQEEGYNKEKILVEMDSDVSCIIVLLFVISHHLHNVNTDGVASCIDGGKNHRMLGKVLKVIRVYTPLQCQDKCFRSRTCDGINLNLDRNARKLMSCELLETNSSSRLVAENNWVYKKLNRTNVKELWVCVLEIYENRLSGSKTY